MSILTIALPIAGALLAIFNKKTAKYVALATSSLAFIVSMFMFARHESSMSLLSLHSTTLSSGAYMAAAFITLLTVIYSMSYMDGDARENEFYCYVLGTLAASAGVFFANDFLTLLLFWGILGATLYMLIGIGHGAERPAMKAFIIAGGSDALMILGIAIVMGYTKTLQIGLVSLPVSGFYPTLAFLTLCIGAFAKAGAVPFHTWIPDAAEKAPVPVMALLPASLDKLLGIYLLIRLCSDVFVVLPNSAAAIFLMIVGSVTVIVTVTAAMLQNNLKKLLAYQAVAQVGYIIMGIATALPIGIAGALFHMLNHAIYKSCLFMTAGSIESKTRTTDFDKLGGLSKLMPITFITTLIAALSLAGVPPMSGFFSKWMIFQGIVQTMDAHNMWIIWLTVAMFGSAVTMASFAKMIHAVFLGRDVRARSADEVNIYLWAPAAVLAAVCVLFGVFAYQLPIPYFIFKAIGGVMISGYYSPINTALLLIVGLGIGLFVYYLSRSAKTVTKPAYIGGEIIEPSLTKVSGSEFYNTIQDIRWIGWLVNTSKARLFDMFELTKDMAMALNKLVSWLHNGSLTTYVSWMLLGAIILLTILIK
jgi:formate hydrogenlyase subunit 3/multisubunit Na+/H+ antiporter MnhD subunit